MATYLGHQEDSSGNILLPTPHSMATQIEFGTTASQAYAKGAYVVFNNRLCKASTAIASGDTLAIGTNLVQCSIGSELNSHLQAPNGNEFYFDYKDNKPGFYPSASKVASEFVPFGGTAEITVSNMSQSFYNDPIINLPTAAINHKITLMVLPMYSGVGGYNNMNTGNITFHSNCDVEILNRTLESDGHIRQAVYKVTNVKAGATFSIASNGSGTFQICIIYLD